MRGYGACLTDWRSGCLHEIYGDGGRCRGWGGGRPRRLGASPSDKALDNARPQQRVTCNGSSHNMVIRVRRRRRPHGGGSRAGSSERSDGQPRLLTIVRQNTRHAHRSTILLTKRTASRANTKHWRHTGGNDIWASHL